MKKQTFLEYSLQLDGYDYYINGSRVYRFELYASKIPAKKVLNGQVKGLKIQERPKYDPFS